MPDHYNKQINSFTRRSGRINSTDRFFFIDEFSVNATTNTIGG
jgi:hypothetical protein